MITTPYTTLLYSCILYCLIGAWDKQVWQNYGSILSNLFSFDVCQAQRIYKLLLYETVTNNHIYASSFSKVIATILLAVEKQLHPYTTSLGYSVALPKFLDTRNFKIDYTRIFFSLFR